MRLIKKATFVALASFALAAAAFASLSGVFLVQDQWDAPVNDPSYTTAREDPLERMMWIDTASNSVKCKYTGWWYTEGPLAEYAPFFWDDGEIIVKVNGQIYVTMSAGWAYPKPIMPNVIFTCDIPEAMFQVGDNIVEFYNKFPAHDNPASDGWYYKMKVTRS